MKFDIESHLSYNTNKIIAELIHEIIIYGYNAGDTLKDYNILRFYNRIEQLYFFIKDIINDTDKEKKIEDKVKKIMEQLQVQKRRIESLNLLEDIKSLYLDLLFVLQDRQYFFRVTRYTQGYQRNINEKEIFDSHNSYDTNKIIAIQIMTIVGMGSEAGDNCDFLSYYRYFNRVDMLYFFVRPILFLEEKEIDEMREVLINQIYNFEVDPINRNVKNLASFSYNVRNYHKKIINILQMGRYLFRIRTVKDKSLGATDIFFESSVYGDN